MLHDPYANATPSQLEACRERGERLQKMKPPEKLFVPKPQDPVIVSWIERQFELNPIKEPWFTLDEIEQTTIRPKIDDIQRIVAKFYEISRVELIAERRMAYLVRARQVGMYLCKKLTVRSLPEIGRRFGNRDHTTVLHAVRKIEAMVERDKNVSADVESLRTLIMGAIG